jgi:hypothetical protein
MIISRLQPNAAPLPVRQDPKAVVLNLVNPTEARRRPVGRTRQARIEGRKGLLGIQAAPKLTRNRHHAKDKRRGSGVESRQA